MLLIRYIRPLSLYPCNYNILNLLPLYEFIVYTYSLTLSLSQSIASIVYHNFSSNNEALQESIVLRLLKCEKLFFSKSFCDLACVWWIDEAFRLAYGLRCGDEWEWMDGCVCVCGDRSIVVGWVVVLNCRFQQWSVEFFSP